MDLDRTAPLAEYITQHGLPPVVDPLLGPRLEHFHASELAAGIEQEVARAHRIGWTKIVLTMALADAMALARALRERME